MKGIKTAIDVVDTLSSCEYRVPKIYNLIIRSNKHSTSYTLTGLKGIIAQINVSDNSILYQGNIDKAYKLIISWQI